MSKFCSKCGEQLNDDAVFCNKCGAQVAEKERFIISEELKKDNSLTNRQTNAMPLIFSKAINKIKSNKKTQIGVAALSVLLIVLILALNILPNYFGYKNLPNKVINAIIDEDTEKLENTISEYHSYERAHSMAEDMIETVSEYLGEQFPKNIEYEIDYEVKSDKKLSERKYKALLHELEDEDYYTDEITEARTIKGKITAKSLDTKKEKNAFIKYEFFIIKEDGHWTLLYYDFDD